MLVVVNNEAAERGIQEKMTTVELIFISIENGYFLWSLIKFIMNYL